MKIEYSRKIMLFVALVAIILFSFIFVSMFKKTRTSLQQNNVSSDGQSQPQQESISETDLTAEGKIESIGSEKIKIKTLQGESLELNIPQQDVQFFKESEDEDGNVIHEEIGLFDIPQDAQVLIEYSSPSDMVKIVKIVK